MTGGLSKRMVIDIQLLLHGMLSKRIDLMKKWVITKDEEHIWESKSLKRIE